MSKLIEEWRASEPEVGGVMDTLRVELIGYFPAKTETIRTRFPFDGFGIVLKGNGFYRVDKGPVRRLQAPSVFYIWSGPLFHYGPDPDGSWEERYLCFTGQRVRDWLRWRWLSRPDRPRNLTEPDMLAQLHQHICRAFPPFSEIPIDQAKIEVEQLVHELNRLTLSPSSQKDKLAVLIQHWIKEPESAGNLPIAAQELGMSYSSFRQHFARRTGLAPYQFLLRLRIDQACFRLAQTDEPVKAVARDCGFTFVESFNRAFHLVKGIPPSEYRRRMRLLKQD